MRHLLDRLPCFLRHDLHLIARHQVKDHAYNVLVCLRCKRGYLQQEVIR